MPAVPFASWADMGRALVVMRPIMSEGVPGCQNASRRRVRAYRGSVAEPQSSEEYTVVDEKDRSRYALTRGGELLSVLDYADDGRTIALTRAFTIPTFRGAGHAARVVEGAVADLEARGDRKVDAVCWYVADWFAAHPEHAGLLRER